MCGGSSVVHRVKFLGEGGLWGLGSGGLRKIGNSESIWDGLAGLLRFV